MGNRELGMGRGMQFFIFAFLDSPLLVLKCKMSKPRSNCFSYFKIPYPPPAPSNPSPTPSLPPPQEGPARPAIYNQLQIITAMSAQQVANLLSQIGSNERKLQYCRQILADHPHFTPQGVFNLNSKTSTNTLYRNQFLELLKTLGLNDTHSSLQKVFQYFQVEGKNYISLEEFSPLVMPQTPTGKKITMGQNDKRLLLDYQLRFSLQKFFNQVLENQLRTEQLSTFTLEKEGSRMKYKKIDPAGIKAFLASQGKYPTDSIIQTIHREISVNKGSSKRNKNIVEFVLEYNQKKGNNVQKQGETKEITPQNEAKKISYEQKETKERGLSARPIQEKSALQSSERNTSKALCDISSGVNNKSIARETSFKAPNPNTQQDNVESRIKTLMESITIKPSLPKPPSKYEKTEEKENYNAQSRKIVVQSKPDQTFSQVSVTEKVSARKAITDRLATMNIYLNEQKKEPNIPTTLTRKTSIYEEQPKNTQTAIQPRSKAPSFSQNRKENSSVLSSSKPTGKAQRMQYLKNLVGRDSSTRGVQTFRS